MKVNKIKPKVFSSRCLGFAACRWDGVTIPYRFVEKLKPFVEYLTTFPEAEIGLGIPRDPVRIVVKKCKYHLIQLNTERDDRIFWKVSGFACWSKRIYSQ